jgi:nucleoside-diphosphate-sugar epimerase
MHQGREASIRRGGSWNDLSTERSLGEPQQEPARGVTFMSGEYRWLVTGGAGFLGVHVCRGLLQRGQKVASYDITPFPAEEMLEHLVTVVGDIRDVKKLDRALRGVDFVVHAAAALAFADPAEVASVNAEGNKHVLEAAARAGVRRVIYIGTTAVYGMPKFHPIFEDAPLDPMGPYGVAKAKAEQYCVATNDIETVRLRPKSFIGSGRLGIFQVLFDWIESGKRIPVLGDGRNKFQLLDVRDLVEAIYLAALKGRNKEVYNIGAASFRTVNEDLGQLLDFAGTGSRILHVPSSPTKAVLEMLHRLGVSPIYRWVYDTADQDSYVSIDRAQRELGWDPKYSNGEALTNTYEWYLKHGKEMAKQSGMSHRVAWNQGALRIVKFFM